MATFNLIKIVLFVWLCSSCFAQLDGNVIEPITVVETDTSLPSGDSDYEIDFINSEEVQAIPLEGSNGATAVAKALEAATIAIQEVYKATRCIKLILLTIARSLQSSTFFNPPEVNYGSIDEKLDEVINSSLGDSYMNDLPSKEQFEDYTEVTTPVKVGFDARTVKVINYGLNQLNMGTTGLFKEQVDKVIEIRKDELGNGEIHHIILHLTQSKCKKDDASCDARYDPVYEKSPKYNPIIAALEPPIKTAKEIFIAGRIPVNSEGFHITIHTGYERPIVAQLRISVEFSNEGNAVLLEYFDEGWNFDQHHRGLLETKTNFTISIVCLSTMFTIYVNDRMLSFNHALPYEDATHLSIFGEVDITKVTGIGPKLSLVPYNPSQAWKNDRLQYQDSVYVPFTAPLGSPLKPGRSITIKGRTPPLSKWFSVFIQTGADDNPKTVQLRVSFSFSINNIKLDYYSNNTWLGADNYRNAILRLGDPFVMVITCLDESFKISINRRSKMYRHRLPYEGATHLRISGRVHISEIVGIDNLPPIRSFDSPPATPLHLPLHDLPLTAGRKIKIWAYVPENAQQFSVRLGDGAAGTSIIFEMKFSISDENWFIEFNTYNGTWGLAEQKSDLNWFKVGEDIQIDIECLENDFQVSLFNDNLYNFTYRLPLNNATHLSIWHDILVQGVGGECTEPTVSLHQTSSSRVCEMNVWHKPLWRWQLPEMYFNELSCVDDSLLNNHTSLSPRNPGFGS